ncbi:spore wall protein 25-like [Vairimorpha necatrix]|uniref:Spore wall protein 25-like n=1 Tax=Vairimorpha necatrix TaxID=6039 RepID=A0AAX4JDZ2_9MICR
MLCFSQLLVFGMISVASCSSLMELVQQAAHSDSYNKICVDPKNCSRECDIKIPTFCIAFTDVYSCIAKAWCRPKCAIKCKVLPFVDVHRRHSVPCYVKKTLCYIEDRVGKKAFCCIKNDAIKILECIERNLRGGRREYALFTATILHNTSFLKVFEAKGDCCTDKYKSRGLLMITYEKNYKLLEKISCEKISYSKRPELLALPLEINIVNTILFWERLMNDKPKNFETMMDVLKPVSWLEYVKNDKQCPPALDIVERRRIYNELLVIYEN